MANGFNLIGCPSSNIGLGAAARNSLGLLLASGRPVSVLDLESGFGRSGHETSFDRLLVKPGARLAHPVNLWHVNPPEVGFLMRNHPDAVDWSGFNVCVPFWELPKLPRNWIP